jgi:hypothetical protein
LHNASVVKLPTFGLGRMVASTRPRRLEVRVGAHGAVAIAPRALDAKPHYVCHLRATLHESAGAGTRGHVSHRPGLCAGEGSTIGRDCSGIFPFIMGGTLGSARPQGEHTLFDRSHHYLVADHIVAVENWPGQTDSIVGHDHIQRSAEDGTLTEGRAGRIPSFLCIAR